MASNSISEDTVMELANLMEKEKGGRDDITPENVSRLFRSEGFQETVLAPNQIQSRRSSDDPAAMSDAAFLHLFKEIVGSGSNSA